MLTDSEAALAEAVLLHGPITRQALSDRLGLSAGSLTRLAKPFLARGLLVEVEEMPDGLVGRPVKPLDIGHGLPGYAGVKITGQSVHSVATDVRANQLARHNVALRSHAPDAVVSAIVESVAELDVPYMAGVGVSLGGSVSNGVIGRAPFLEWRDVPLRMMLEESLDVPVSVENDLVALAEAQRWYGMGKGLSGFAVITIGAGVGYALVANNTVTRSHDAGLGLAAHVPLSAGGPRCHEGHTGCAQAMLTDEFIASAASTALARTVDRDEALALAHHEPAVRAVLEDSGQALGRLIALAANLSLQSDVILAGEGIGLLELVEETVRATIVDHRDPLASHVTLHVDDSGFDGWARGAAVVAIQSSLKRFELR
ncbi:ROK family transcriptional regulator [Tessaracoccus terricola]